MDDSEEHLAWAKADIAVCKCIVDIGCVDVEDWRHGDGGGDFAAINAEAIAACDPIYGWHFS